ncbi:MAG: PEP-CTERM sorting domain-containing protein [Geminicoccaceae bacterium]
MVRQLFAATALCASMAMTASASATLYTYTDAGATLGGGENPGSLGNITASFDSVSQIFEWMFEYDPGAAEAFWLVVSDGENPKGVQDQLAILFGDLLTGQLTSYVYNGANNTSSIDDPSILLTYFGDDVIDVALGGGSGGRNKASFTINVADLNSNPPTPPGPANWEGLSFGEQIGVWFHTSEQDLQIVDSAGFVPGATSAGSSLFSTFGGCCSFFQPVASSSGGSSTPGTVESFGPDNKGNPSTYYDIANRPTTPTTPPPSSVPEPATATAFAIGLLGLAGVYRRRRHAIYQNGS